MNGNIMRFAEWVVMKYGYFSCDSDSNLTRKLWCVQSDMYFNVYLICKTRQRTMTILEQWLGSTCILLLRCSLTLNFASLGNLSFQNQPVIRSLYASNFITFEFSSKKIYQVIIFKEIFANIIYINIFTVLKNATYCWWLFFLVEHFPGKYSTRTHKNPHFTFLVEHFPGKYSTWTHKNPHFTFWLETGGLICRYTRNILVRGSS